MKASSLICDNQNGIAIVIVLMVLALITLAGVMATRTSTTELEVATSDQIYKISFYASEAARGYVSLNSGLYSSANIEPGNPVSFPDAGDPTVKQLLDAASNQSFNGQVQYLSSSTPPRGSGFQVGKFKAHVYQMNCFGYGPRESETEVEAGFYRIGF
jgi:hypothetical protein